MTATLTTRDALLAAIRENPAEDTPRLVFADWLDENGFAERAEFIRVQIELANIPDPPVDTTAGLRAAARKQRLAALREWKSEWRGRYYDLRTRQQQLLADPHNFVNWTPSVMHTGSLAGIRYETGGTVGLFGNGFESATFTRGFVERVRCSLDAWLKHGPAIVRAHPVTRVEVTDRVPLGLSGNRMYSWLRGIEYADAPHRLPADVFDAIPVADPPAYVSLIGAFATATEAAAHAALSDALLAWARAA